MYQRLFTHAFFRTREYNLNMIKKALTEGYVLLLEIEEQFYSLQGKQTH